MANVTLIAPPLAEAVGPDRLHVPVDIPRGLLTIAGLLRSRGHHVELLVGDLLDCAIASDAFAVRLAASCPDWVGITGYTLQHGPLRQTAERIAQAIPDVPIYAGGPHATALGEALLQDCPALSGVVLGEGEWTALELSEAIDAGRELRAIAGTLWRDDDDTLQLGPARPPGDLSQLPPPCYELLPGGWMRLPVVSIVSSRGCRHGCAFCAEGRLWPTPMRVGPAAGVVAEVQRLARQYRLRRVALEDSVFDPTDPRFEGMLDALAAARERAAGSHWPAISIQRRVDRFRPEGLSALGRAGVDLAWFGIESGDDEVRRGVGKRFSDQQIWRVLDQVRRAGIAVGTYWIVGLPGETPVSAAKSRHLFERLAHAGLIDHAEVSIFVPYPGTAVFEDPKRYGVRIRHRRWDDYGRFNTMPVHDLVHLDANAIYAEWQHLDQLAARTLPDAMGSCASRQPGR